MDDGPKLAEKQEFNFTSILLAFIIVGAVTATNIWWNGSKAQAQTVEYEKYFGYGFSFEYPRGTTLNVSGFGGIAANESAGVLSGFLEGEDQLLEEIIIIWSPPEPVPRLEEALENVFGSGQNDTSFTIKQYGNSSKDGHDLLYAYFTASNPDTGAWSGVLGIWNCTQTGRMFTVYLAYPGGSTLQGDLETCFQQFLESFRCHPFERFPGKMRPARRNLPDAVADLVNVSLMVLLCIGFTFTFMMEKFPNFAHVNYATIGSMVSFYMVRAWGFDPYDTWPFAALFGGAVGVILYIGVVRPIGERTRKWTRDIVLTFTSFVIAQMLVSITGIFSYWVRYYSLKIPSRGFVLKVADFNLNGLPGISLIGPLACVVLVVGLHLFLTRTRSGISLRATAEDEDLAAVLGINTFHAHIASWFISGALSALAGSIITLWRGMGFGGSDDLLISVMAGSALGGLSNIYGAIIGGVLVAMAQKTLSYVLLQLFGLGVKLWERLFPIIFIYVIMTVMPNGLTGLKDPLQSLRSLRAQLKRLKSALLVLK